MLSVPTERQAVSDDAPYHELTSQDNLRMHSRLRRADAFRIMRMRAKARIFGLKVTEEACEDILNLLVSVDGRGRQEMVNAFRGYAAGEILPDDQIVSSIDGDERPRRRGRFRGLQRR